MTDKRIIFLGTPEISAFVLKGLIESGFNIVGVITKEDKIRGRNNQVEASDVALMADKYNIPLHKPHKLNDDFKFISDLNPDLLLTFAYGQIISDEVLALSKYKPLNLHASLLPKYRGAAPIQYALRNGEEKTGVSLMEMVHKLDAGDIYAVKELVIDKKDNYSTLANKLATTALDLAKESLPLYFDNKLTPIKQDDNLASFCPTIKKEEEKLNLELNCDAFINQVRSLSLVPGGYLLLNEEKIKIFECEKFNEETHSKVGKIVLARKNLIILQLKDGQIKINSLQKPGKRIMSANDFNNGNHNLEGNILK